MATVTLSVQDITRAGVTTTYTASGASPLLNTSDTFVFANTGKEYIPPRSTLVPVPPAPARTLGNR